MRTISNSILLNSKLFVAHIMIISSLIANVKFLPLAIFRIETGSVVKGA